MSATRTSTDLLVTSTHTDRVAVITLDSPRNRNALSVGLLDDLAEALTNASSDPDVGVLLLRANGPSFCSGADLKSVSTGSMEPLLRRVMDVQHLIVEIDKPVVARVHGAVRAGGLGLVAAADIAIGASSTHFALTEVRLGLAAAVVSVTVRERMGDRPWSELLMTGRVFDGFEAAQVGMLTRAVPPEQVDTAIGAVIADLLAGSAQGLREAKRLANASVRDRLARERDSLVALSTKLFASDESRVAIAKLMAASEGPGLSGVDHVTPIKQPTAIEPSNHGGDVWTR